MKRQPSPPNDRNNRGKPHRHETVLNLRSERVPFGEGMRMLSRCSAFGDCNHTQLRCDAHANQQG